MNRNKLCIIGLLAHTVSPDKCGKPDCGGVDWNELYRDSLAHNISEIVYHTVAGLPEEVQPEEELLSVWKANTLRNCLMQINKERRLGQLLSNAFAQGVRPIVVKGPVLGMLYPNRYARITSDWDVLISRDEIDRIYDVLNRMGCCGILPEDISWHELPITLDDGTLFEIHTRLWEDEKGRRLETLERLNLTEPATLTEISVGGASALTLGINQQLVYMLYHAMKHFMLAGIGLRHLTDLTLYINNNFDELDNAAFWSAMDELGCGDFCAALFTVCVRYFGLKSEFIQDCKPLYDSLTDRLLEDILEGGIFGKQTAARNLSIRIYRPYYDDENKKMPRNRVAMLLSFLFPGPDSLRSIDRTKLHHNRVFAWFQRLLYLTNRFRSSAKKERRCSLRARIACAYRRIQIMHDMKLIHNLVPINVSNNNYGGRRGTKEGKR